MTSGVRAFRPAISIAEQQMAPKAVDSTTLLSVWLVLLFLLSSRLVVPGLGGIGQPATLLALFSGVWWVSVRFVPQLYRAQSFNPVRIMLFAYFLYFLLSFAIGAARPLTDLEKSGSARALIMLVALLSIALLVLDGAVNIDRLTRLLRRLTSVGALFALYGILQGYFGDTYLFAPPGLVWNQDVVPTLLTRGVFLRPSATGGHPIEYAAVVGALLPLALHFVFHPKSSRDRVLAVAETVILAYALPVSLSRTAIVCAATGLIVLAFGWDWRRRMNVILTSLVSLPLFVSVQPDLVSYTFELFRNVDDDASIMSRIDRVPRILGLIRERPWFGRGHGTYSVEEYFLIDNQLWVTVISSGIIGLLLVLALPVVAILVVVRQPDRLVALTPEVRHLGWAVAASITALMVSTVTFTAFSYHILTFALFLLIGSAGAFYRLTRHAAAPV